MVDISKFEEEDAQGYRINIVGRSVLVTDAMKNYVWDKISKIERFHNHIFHADVTLDIQRLEHTCVIILKFNNFLVKVHADSTDMYASIDKAIDRLQTKLRRWKSKMQDYHQKAMREIDMTVNVMHKPYNELDEINEEIAKKNQPLIPKVIGTETRRLKTLTIEEAMMKMDLSNDRFMVFRDEKDRKLKVIYVRTDGNYGIIEPEA